MTRREVVSLFGFTALGLVSLFSPTWAQQKTLNEQLLQTWMLVSASATRPDGTSNNGRLHRTSGCPHRHQMVALQTQGCNTHWGRYTVDETKQTLTLTIEHAMFPNLEGTQQTRPIEISGDKLMISSPGAAGGTAVLIWRQAK